MLSSVITRRRPSSFLRYIGPACVLLLLAYSFSLPSKIRMIPTAASLQHGSNQQNARQRYHTPPRIQQIPVVPSEELKQSQNSNKHDQSFSGNSPVESTTGSNTGKHPIEALIEEADKKFQDMRARESHSLHEAAEAYRKRRGRHPPPDFDSWYRFAAERNAVIVEDFWDQIYHDLHPFWALPAWQVQQDGSNFEMTIRIREGRASTNSTWFWTQIWLDMIQSIEYLLPDMDIALNAMDEPRVVVPWEEMRNYVTEADKTETLAQPEDVAGRFQQLGLLSLDENKDAVPRVWEISAPYWDIVRRACAPLSKVRQTETQTRFDGPPRFSHDSAALEHMRSGFVANSSLASDVCHQPDLQGLQGIFIEPLSISSTPTLFPIFGGSKLSVNSDILLPAPMYWSQEERFSAGGDEGVPWAEKRNKAVWRGVATGGRNRATNWRGFHRHRFVAMNNGTALSWAEARAEATNPGAAEEGQQTQHADSGRNFELPDPSYKLGAQAAGKGQLGAWVDSWSDCAFVDLMCSEPKPDGEESRTCPYTDPYFQVAEGIPLHEQFDSKYLPDIDGNSFSGRYLAFLRSTSLPIKSTLWREWHDARLVAWKHFVPMDSRFGDWFGIMEYFLGYRGGENGEQDAVAGHDAAAEKIAAEGKAWADRVLRREDMQIYVFRLLLEYARVADEKRARLGWVDDLLPPKPAAQ